MRQHGCKLIKAPFPIGPDGTTEWIKKIYSSIYGIPSPEINEKIEKKEKLIWNSLKHEIALVKGKSVFFMGDNLLELSLARFLISCGMIVYEVGIPNLDERYQGEEIKLLRKTCARMNVRLPALIEKPDNYNQIKRIMDLKPDLIIFSIPICIKIRA